MPPTTDEFPASAPRPGPPNARVALGEVILCSGYPTQLALAGVLHAIGLRPTDDAGRLSASFLFTLSLADAALLLALITVFLRRHGECPRDVFLGTRSVAHEGLVGIAMAPLLLTATLALLVVLRTLLPALHNVPENPLAAFVQSPWSLAGLFLVVVIAGGVREELQRAFLLHRFEQRLGGAWVGLAVTTVAFGLGHTLQGWDAAVATAFLGFVWGLLYLSRRSAVAGVVSHALFNSAEVIRAAIGR
jgi:membrane protease YdiL (CAAX protease family)